MIFIVHPDRSVTSVLESINVGDTAADIIVISPFSGIQCCSLKYLLPNGAEAPPQFLTFQGEGLAMGSGYDGVIYTMKIPVAMTRIIGTVQVSFVFTDAQARSFASDTASFTVGGIESLPFPDSEEQGEDFAAQLQAQKVHVDNAAERAEQINDRAEAAVRSFEAASAEAEMIDCEEEPQVSFSIEEGEDGEKYANFQFKIPRGPTGYSPEFCVIDGKLCVKKTQNAEYEPLDIDVKYNTDKISAGEDCAALTDGSIAFGKGSTAGARGFGVTSFDPSNRQIKIALKSPVTDVYAAPAYANGDYFSILNGSHYAFCGKIESVSVSGNTATITYTPTTEHGTNSSRTEPWWVFDPKTFIYNIRAAFWVPAKPLVGYDLKYEGTEAFPNAVAMGGAIAAAMGAFVSGRDCVAGGNYAAIFGTENMGAYGNLMSGRESFSSGLHSALLGRTLTNHGDYNLLANRLNQILRGNYNALFGYNNKIESGNNSLIAGSNHLVKAHNVFASGGGHEITHGHMGAIGYMLKSTRSGQLLVGQLNEETKSIYSPDLFVVAYGDSTQKIPKNLFTVNDKGTLEKDTDGVTYKHMKNYVASVRTSMETALLNGSW